MKFTSKSIEALSCPAGAKDALFFDDEVKGLGVRVTASGGKTYLVQYRIGEAKRRVKLKACRDISVKVARDAAKIILGDVAKGLDPAMARKEAREEERRQKAREILTLDALLDDWTKLHLAHKRPQYAAEAVRSLRHAFPRQLSRPADELARATVVTILDRLATKGRHAMASRTAAYGRAAFRWAIKRGSLAANPFADLPVTPTTKRDRVLSDDELAAIWKATSEPGPFNAIARMLMVTGQRREEVAGMLWSEIDGATWTIRAERAKNGKTHIVPLSSAAMTIIAEQHRPTIKDAGALVIPGRAGAFNGFSKAKAALDTALAKARPEDADEEPLGWRLHDLRRTVATGMQALGIRLEVVEAILNHTSGSRAGIVGLYQRHDYAEEKRAALEAWGARLMNIVEDKEQAPNVIALRKSA